MDEINSSKNADLAYQHTLGLFKEQKDSIIRLDTKLSALLGFSGLSLRFTESLHSMPMKSYSWKDPETWCLIFKILSCIFALICSAVCVSRLTAKTRGSAVSPEFFFKKDFYEADEDTNKYALTLAWIETLNEYEGIGRKKDLH
jgi:hypothetical protein